MTVASDRGVVARLWRMVLPHWRVLVVAFALITVGAAFDVVVPYLLKVAIDAHIAIHRASGLALIVVLFAAGVIARAFVRMGSAYALGVLGQRTANDLRAAVHTHLLGRSAAFFDRHQVGRLMATVTSDVDSVNQMFTTGVITFAVDLVALIAIVVTMLWLSVELTLVTLVVLPLLWPAFAWSRRLIRGSFRQVGDAQAALSAYIVERLSGLAVVQMFGRERATIEECATISRRYRDAALTSLRAGAPTLPVTDAAAWVAVALLFGYVGLGRELASAGLVVAFVEYANRFYAPIAQLGQKLVVGQSGLVGCERVFAVLDTGMPDAPAATMAALAKAANPTEPVPAIELRGVHFAYRPEEPVLRGLDLTVAAGTSVAVVGATGAGKSTLARLLSRHYEPQAGEVRVHGRDVRGLPIDELRGRLTIVAQDVIVFAGTIADNIRLGRPSASNAELELALQRVGGGRLLERAGGIDAEIAERGANMSAGELQLISFARALVRDPDVLVLDEATANVDPETEAVIERALATLFTGRTSLIIAHRLATVRRADRIVVIAGGLVAEEGTRDELVAAGGLYAQLETELSSS